MSWTDDCFRSPLKRSIFLIGGWVACLFFCSSVTHAQLLDRKLFSRSPSVNTDHIPTTAVASVVIFPKKIVDDPQLDLVPREIITAWGVKEFGFDPLLLTQVTVVVRSMTDLEQPPQWAAVLHFDQMQGLGGATTDQLEKKQLGGKLLYSGENIGMPSFLLVDEARMLVGDETFFSEMLAATDANPSRLAEIIQQAKVTGQLQAFADIESARALLNETATAMPFWLPPAVLRLKRLPDILESVELGFQIDGVRAKTDLTLHTASAESAEQAGEILSEAMEFGTDLLLASMAGQLDLDDPVQQSLFEYLQRVAAEMLKKWSPEIVGNGLTMHFDEEATAVPILIGLLLPAGQAARAAASRSQSMNNMKQTNLALLNYESATGKLPGHILDKNGKPLLSWRVAILPYIEQQELYDQFHLDEPWDSPHNEQLIAKMPQTYASPNLGAMNGKTIYLGIAGEGMLFDGKERRFNEITDGTSNTVCLVEVNPELAVPWTQPADFEVDERNPVKGLGDIHNGVFNVSMLDGSVHAISKSIDPKSWYEMLTISGGEVPRE